MDGSGKTDSQDSLSRISGNRFRHMKRWQRALFGVLSALFCLLISLGLLEGVLSFIGYGYPTSFFLKDPVSGMVIENERFVWQFFSPKSPLKPHPFRFAAKKAPDSIRIFVLGESAAMGTPEPAFGFGRVLERMLNHRYPDQSVQVINLAMRGINSHMIRTIASECVDFEPDLVIFYGGNNELVGWQAPGPDSKGTQSLGWIRFQQVLRSSHSGQWLRSLMSSFRFDQEPEQDMAFFHEHRLHPDDPRRQIVLDRFATNLDETFDVLSANGIPVLVGSVVVNERDCPPLGSLFQSDLNENPQAQIDTWLAQTQHEESEGDLTPLIALLKQALKVDNRHAESHFRLARIYEMEGDTVSARLHYRQAKDCDALPFRATSSIQEVIKEAAQSSDADSLAFVDLEALFREHPACVNGVPGYGFFYEHVHFRFNGDYTIASYLFPFVQDILKLTRHHPDKEVTELLSLVDCAKQLGYNPVLEAMMVQSMIQLQKGPPFLDQVDHSDRIEALEKEFSQRYGNFGPAHFKGAIQWIRDAMQENPDDWNLPFLAARIAARLKDYETAIQLSTKARDLMPHASIIRVTLASYLAKAGKKQEARSELEYILEMIPGHPEASAAMGAL